MIVEKVCSHCGIAKRSDLFYRRSSTSDRLASWCKQCVRLAKVEYRRTETYRRTQAAYRADPEVCERSRRLCVQYYWTHRERFLERGRTLKARLRSGRSHARRKLREAVDPVRKDYYRQLVILYDRELSK